jgi:hypothetical protein
MSARLKGRFGDGLMSPWFDWMMIFTAKVPNICCNHPFVKILNHGFDRVQIPKYGQIMILTLMREHVDAPK